MVTSLGIVDIHSIEQNQSLIEGSTPDANIGLHSKGSAIAHIRIHGITEKFSNIADRQLLNVLFRDNLYASFQLFEHHRRAFG